jgi:hypothetical protein
MAIENLNINYKTQNKVYTNPHIKNHKKSHELKLIRPQTQHRNPEPVFKFLTAQNCESSLVQKVYKPSNTSQCES